MVIIFVRNVGNNIHPFIHLLLEKKMGIFEQKTGTYIVRIILIWELREVEPWWRVVELWL